MNKKVKAFQDKFNEFIFECQRFCFMSRAKEFQLEACEKLSELRKEASRLKEQMIAAAEEYSANAILSFEEMINALTSELRMWVALKEDEPSLAWNFLIDAQGAARTAMQAHEVASHLEDYVERLHTLEQLLFPPQVFFSPDIVIEHSKCSICGQEYGECDHIVGRAYMGEMCVRIITEIKEVREVSIVDEPANKHARILTITDGSVYRDFLTWRVVSDYLSSKMDESISKETA